MKQGTGLGPARVRFATGKSEILRSSVPEKMALAQRRGGGDGGSRQLVARGEMGKPFPSWALSNPPHGGAFPRSTPEAECCVHCIW